MSSDQSTPDQSTPTQTPTGDPALVVAPLTAEPDALPEATTDGQDAALPAPTLEPVLEPAPSPIAEPSPVPDLASPSQPEATLVFPAENADVISSTDQAAAVGSATSEVVAIPVLPATDEAAPTVAAVAPESAPVVQPQADATVGIATQGVVISGKPIVLPNGKVGEPYSFQFTPDIVDLRTCLNVRVLGPEGLGLTFDQNTQALAGQPSLAGQHDMRLSYQPADAKAGQPMLIRALQWYVNPDPRSLWTEHEPAADLSARKGHVAHFMNVEGPKTLVAASRRGRSHAKDAKFREDDFRCYYQAESKSYVLAVADGAGSAVMSREGSRLACETASQHLLTALSGETSTKLGQLSSEYAADESSHEARKALQDELYTLLGNAALLAARQITQAAEATKQVARDYATTLLLAVCYPTAKGWLVGAFWIGDGGLGLYRRQEGIRLLGEPDGGEYSGQTRFLTMKETFEATSLYGRVRFELVPDFDALVLMTDGVTDALFQTDSNLAKSEKWAELLDGINEAAPLKRENTELGSQLTEWLNFWVKGEYDDRTIAILF